MEVKEQKKDNKKEGIIPPPKIILHRDKIIKVLEESPLYYVGFDVLSESLYQVSKNKEAIELPEAVIKLLGCEKSRCQVANVLCHQSVIKTAKMLNVHERTAFRMFNEYYYLSENIVVKRQLSKDKNKQLESNKKVKQKLITDGKKGKK